MSRKATAAQFKRVKIFLTDVDGVLTNATVMLNGKTEFKQFNIFSSLLNVTITIVSSFDSIWI